MRTRLLALDLDGTLLRPDGDIDPRDVAAIADVRAAGVRVTIATGRIATGALPTAARLDLDTTLVCAEGAVLVDPQTGAVLYHRPMHITLTETVTEAFDRHALDAFWFLHDEIHGEHGGADLLRYVETWSPRVTLHDALSESVAWENHRHQVTMAVGFGTREAVQLAHATVTDTHGDELLAVTFPASRTEDRWTLLTRSARTDKATGLAQVSEELGIAPHEVAVVGDWLNDVPMFAWAGRSFVMGQSPDEVARHASHRLQATSRDGGGVAEAIRAILADLA
jgi:HAD superfamily hydrolase (TIGR01484 family)